MNQRVYLDSLHHEMAAEGFLAPEEANQALRAACARHPDVARFSQIGTSEETRPIYGIELGRGELTVSLMAGNHSDEPVGPDFLRRLVPALLERGDSLQELLDTFRFVIVPHTNPDGEARNRRWIDDWPDFRSYLQYAFREPPGRDMEFGFTSMRVENRVASDWLRRHAPIDLHVNLHGMGIAEGVMLLIEKRWGYRTDHVQDAFSEAARAAGLPFHDHNRKGEKGFFYLGPGFATTPEGEAMRSYFRARGDEETASLFRDSSMEFVRELGGDPLCLVTELPLFLVGRRSEGPAAVPNAYLALKELLPDLRLKASIGEEIGDVTKRFGIRPVPLRDMLGLQLGTLAAALEQILLCDRTDARSSAST